MNAMTIQLLVCGIAGALVLVVLWAIGTSLNAGGFLTFSLVQTFLHSRRDRNHDPLPQRHSRCDWNDEMTEEEAKTKWCPFARTGLNGAQGAVAVNRSIVPMRLDLSDAEYSVFDETRCIGSACMAWRWANVRHGSCGLAGKP